MESLIRIKILAVSGILTSASTRATTTKINLTVIEVPAKNPYGVDYQAKAVPFEIQVHNENIKSFNINSNNVGEVADVELIHLPYKKDEQTPTIFNLLVNSLNFVI